MPGNAVETFSLDATGPPPRTAKVWMRTGVVSWLRVAPLAFPTLVSGIVSNAYCYPLQWRGRTGMYRFPCPPFDMYRGREHPWLPRI